MQAKVGDTLDLQTLADKHRWDKGLTMVVQVSMRAVTGPGSVELLAAAVDGAYVALGRDKPV